MNMKTILSEHWDIVVLFAAAITIIACRVAG